MHLRLATFATIASCLCANVPLAMAQPAQVEFERGRKLIEAGQFPEACEAFAKANAADSQGVGIVLNLGLCNEKQRKWRTALGWYRKALEMARTAGAAVQVQAAEKRIADLRDMSGKVHLEFDNQPPADTTVLLDGGLIGQEEWSAIEIDSGVHSIEVRAAGYQSYREEVDIQQGVRMIRVRLLPASKVELAAKEPRHGGPTNWKRNAVMFGAPGVALIVASPVYSYFNSQSKCTTTAACDAVDKRTAIVGNTLWISGAVLVGVGAYYWFAAPKRTTKTAWVPVVSDRHAGFAVSGQF